MPVFATGGFHGTHYCKETAFGVTPEYPQMKGLRHTSNSLILSKETFQSQELRSDGQISDLRHGNRQASGDIGFEFSFGEYDELLAAAVRGEWKDNPDVPGWKVLEAGTKVSSFTIERVFNDVQQYESFKGCEVNSFSFTVQPNAMVTGTIGIVGSSIHFSKEPIDPDPEPSLTFSPFDGFKGKLVEGGIVIGVVTSMEVNIENNIEPAFVIGSDVAEALVPGRINITGTISAYFQNMELLKKFTDEIETSLQFTLGDGVHESYIVTLPRVKYSGGDNPVDSEGPVTLNMPFQALYDTCSGTNIRVDRIPPAEVEECAFVYSADELHEDANNPGVFPDAISVDIVGGNGMKTFTGTIGQAIPGVVFSGVPDGLTAEAIKTTASTVEIRLKGTAADPVQAADLNVQFTPVSLMFSFCHCPNEAAKDNSKNIAIIPA